MGGYKLQSLNWMVSLHHNGLNWILADKMANVLISDLHLLKHLCRPQQNPPNNLVQGFISSKWLNPA
jgi:hypothetical protein